MMDKRLISRLAYLTSHEKNKCQHANLLNVEQLFRKHDIEIMEILDLNYIEATGLVARAAESLFIKPKSAWELLQSSPPNPLCLAQPSLIPSIVSRSFTSSSSSSTSASGLPLSSPLSALRLPRGLIELVAPAGSGKTQCCLTITAQTCLPVSEGGLGSGVIYIDSEGTFTAERVKQIATHRFPKYYAPNTSTNTSTNNNGSTDQTGGAARKTYGVPHTPTPSQLAEIAQRELLQRIYVINATTPQAIKETLDNKIEAAIIEYKAKLLILDGIAAPVRSSYSQTELLARVEFLNIISSRLKYLADKYELTCITTNQVTSKMIENDKAVDSHLEAALGVSWAHAVNTRIILERQGEQRFIKIAKSPMFPCFAFPYIIDSAGVLIQQTEDGHVQVIQHEGGSVIGMKIATTHSQQLGHVDLATLDQIKHSTTRPDTSRPTAYHSVADRPVMSSGIATNTSAPATAAAPTTTTPVNTNLNAKFQPPRQVVRAPQPTSSTHTVPSASMHSSGIPKNPHSSQPSSQSSINPTATTNLSNGPQRYPNQPQQMQPQQMQPQQMQPQPHPHPQPQQVRPSQPTK